MSEEWYVAKEGNRAGPFTAVRIRQMIAGGTLKPDHLVWKQGMAGWLPASSVKGLFGAAVPPGPPPGGHYASPTTNELTFDTRGAGAFGQPLRYAEYMQRVAAALLDGLFTGLMTCIPTVGLIAVLVGLAGNDSDARSMAVFSGQACGQLVSLLIGATYYVCLETSTKQGTWGKQIVGLKVTDMQGNRITVGRAIGRYFAKLLNIFTCGIGLLMPLFTEKKQTLHDMIAGCLALKK
jgi:uncharacterized RDD family membrane protein YckC